MKEKLQRFMVGRYGFDDLSRIFLGITVACMAASLFTRNQTLYLLGLALLIYSYFRSFSRNIEKRRQENQRFCNFRYQRMEQMEGAAGAKENLPFLSMPAVQPERARAKRKR